MSEMSSQDYYKILGVGRRASLSEIKEAYQALLVNDLDKTPFSKAKGEENFKKITQAFEVLSDEHRRRVYDEFSTTTLSGTEVHFHTKQKLKLARQQSLSGT
mmetsp:Transcript_39000/g.70998  ORF Transcript_39000/g.70998 Transcript_39000/m.70998 type:complete len:102 (+) Transcript_39000:90-395(+)